ncbi:MAG: helix-hairpin-helix domain-containing protein [Bacteroidales bacterium]
MWKDWLAFSSREKQGIYLIIAIVVVLLGIKFYLTDQEQKRREILRLNDEIQQLKEKQPSNHFKKTYETKREIEETKKDLIPFSFDPNTIDSFGLIKLGLSSRVAHNLIAYRSKEGRFYKAEDMAKIYGLSSSEFDQLRTYIRIPRKREPKDSLNYDSKRIIHTHVITHKFQNDTIIDLNNTDTITLQKIPGIGTYYAKLIVDYGDKLGGYMSVDQLKEIKRLREGVYDQIAHWFTVNSSAIQPIHINTVSFALLCTHPYIGYDRARAIDQFRRKSKIRSLSELSLLEQFDSITIQKLTPYVVY